GFLPLELVERTTEPVPDVSMRGEDSKRPFFTGPTDQDLRAAWLYGRGSVERAVDAIVLALERGTLFGKHQLDDCHSLVQPVHAPADRRKLVAVAQMLVLVPGRPD